MSGLHTHGVVLTEKIDAVLIHTDPFALRLEYQLAMEALGKAEFELPGVFLQIRFGNGDRISRGASFHVNADDKEASIKKKSRNVAARPQRG